MKASVFRRIQLGFIVIGVIVTVMMLTVVAGCYRDDREIEKNLGVTTALVVNARSYKAAVEYSTADGVFYSPRFGILYPTNLTAGQRITVEYNKSDPEMVRVAGRNAKIAIVPALSVIAVTWAMVIAIMLGCAELRFRALRRRGLQRRRMEPVAPGH